MNQKNIHFKFLFYAITGLFLFTITSCEYNEDGVFERNLNTNVNPPNIETVSLDLDLDKDTVELLYNRVYFNFKSSNQKIKFVIFYIDGDSVGTATTNNGYFDLRYEFLYEKLHRLKLKLFTSSGTGSIADSLNAEGFLFTTKEWVIKVKNTYYYNLTTTVSDGFLKLRWTKPYEPVSEYIIYYYGTEIGRTSACEFIDKGHVGEETTYYVKYISSYSGALTTLGQATVPKEMSLRFYADKNNNYAISWGKLKYYAAVGSITIRSYTDNNGYQDETVTNDNITSSIPIPNTYFGQARTYQILLTPKYFNPIYKPDDFYLYSLFRSSYFKFVIGYPSPIFQNFMHVSNTEVLYHTNKYDLNYTCYNDTLFRYSLTDNKIVDRYRYNPPNYNWSGDIYRTPSTSPNGNYYLATVSIVNSIIIGQSNNLSNFKIIDLDPMIISNYFNPKIPISDVGTGIICGSDKKYLYDFINDRSLGYIQNYSSPDDYNLSPDGKYIFLNFSHTIYMYEYNNNTINSIGTLHAGINDSFDYFRFNANEPNKAVTWSKYSKILKVYSCPGLTVDKSFSLPEDNILDIDYQNNRILSFTSKLLMVRSLTDGSVLYQIPVNFTYVWECMCRLNGNSIFHPNGIRYFLN